VRVRFSPDIFRLQAHGGVSRLFAELHQGLLARSVDSAVLAGLHINGHLGGVDGVHGRDVSGLRPVGARQALTKGVDQLYERWALARLPADAIYHKTYYSSHVPRRERLVVTVFDMIHERYPETMGGRDITLRIKEPWCRAADLVLAISEQTRADLVERYALDADKVVVTHLGVRPATPADEGALVTTAPFVLYVGDRIQPYKNVARLIEAMGAPELADLALVCFGGGALTAPERELAATAGIADRIVQVGGDDRVLAAHYRAARLHVYPSLYEGFGLPPLEAMAQGCPVVASAAGAIPEVVGDAAVLVDPTDVHALADALALVAHDDARRTSLVAAGRERSATFTWDRCTDATLAAYRRLT
jgi:glycosyltransferase involved in cell wall biosynthesis